MKDKTYKYAPNPQYDGCKVFVKKGSDVNLNEILAQEFHKARIRKIKRGKVYSRFKNNISAAYLAEMGSLSSFNHGVQ